MPAHDPASPRVGLFVTCLVDLFRPAVGNAAVGLLERAGCRVEVPPAQSCCGRPALAARDEDDLRDQARSVIETFADYDYVVAPSGSCAELIRLRYPPLFSHDPLWGPRAAALAARTFELADFLARVVDAVPAGPGLKVSVTWHDCRTREPGGESPSLRLLQSVAGLSLRQAQAAARCCEAGAGASASAAREIRATGAGLLVGADLGCLMGIAAELKRSGSAIEVRHVAELLAGALDAPPIGGTAAGRGAETNRRQTL